MNGKQYKRTNLYSDYFCIAIKLFDSEKQYNDLFLRVFDSYLNSMALSKIHSKDNDILNKKVKSLKKVVHYLLPAGLDVC